MRFNIRESVETDSEGNPLSPEQVAFFKNSKIRDGRNGNGKLLVCYHGTDKDFNTFEKGDIGFHFGTANAADARKTFKGNPQKWENKVVYLNITHPLYIDYDVGDWDGHNIAMHIVESSLMDLDDAEIKYLQMIASSRKSTEDKTRLVKEFLGKHDIDGIIYVNAYEDEDSTSYIAFEPNQIKSITNKTPTNSDNINEESLNKGLKEDMKSRIPEQSNLKKILVRFNSNGKYAKQGSWSIASGGYDLNFEIYYQGQPVIQGTQGYDGTEVEAVDSSYADELDTNAIIEFICSAYKDCTPIYKEEEVEDDEEDDVEECVKEDMGSLNKRIKHIWCGAVDVSDGTIEETHSYKEAKAQDFHHSLYFSKPILDKMDEGEAVFFFVGDDGESIYIDPMERDYGTYDEDYLIKRIKAQLKNGLKEDMELNFDRALLDKWIDDLNANGAKYHQTFSYTEGGKYIRVSYTFGGRYDTAVFAFVDADGNIYKPAGWKTPAKGVRARIDQNPPMDEKDLYSARYRAAVYGESVNEAYNKDSLHAKLWNMGHKEQTCFQNGYCVTCYFHDGEGMAKRYTVTNRDGKKVLDCNAGFAWQPQIQKFEDSLLQLLNTGSIKEEILTEKPSPAGYEPTKKGIAYKVFKVKNGKLYPPMVANAGGADTPIGVWLDAEEGEFAGLSKTGRPQVKSTGSGNLSYRPGWHLGDIPRAKQFDRLNKETGEYEFPKDFVWAECEYAMDVDYQPESDARGYERTKVDKDGNVITTKSDKYQHSLAGLPKLPTNGYYKYRTNPNPDTVPWVITGQMKVNRLLSDAEVNAILEKNGIEPIHRQGGDKTLAELGLKEGLGEDWYFHDDDSYFSHEQLLDFASDLEDAIQDRHGMMFTVTSVWFEKDNSLVADVQVGKYGDDMLVSQKVDMRRVKTERDLRKYIPALVDQVTKQAVDDDY